MTGRVTATRLLLHGHRHTATATRPHGHCHTITATQSPPHGHSHPRSGHVPGHVPGHVMSHVPGYVSASLTMGTHQRPLALKHSWRPLALWHPQPLLPFGLRPLFLRGQHLLSSIADGGLRLSPALGPRRPLTYGGLWLIRHS